MVRVPRGQQRAAGAYFHLMNRGHNREVVFPGAEDRAYFREEVVRRGAWTIGDETYRGRMQRAGPRPARRRGRPRKPPPGREGYFPQFFAETQDA